MGLGLVWTVALDGTPPVRWVQSAALATCGTVAVLAAVAQYGAIANDPGFPRSRWRAELLGPWKVAAGAVAAYAVVLLACRFARRFRGGTADARTHAARAVSPAPGPDGPAAAVQSADAH